jgi:hypothetical protein
MASRQADPTRFLRHFHAQATASVNRASQGGGKRWISPEIHAWKALY